jgi:hypothetical protein
VLVAELVEQPVAVAVLAAPVPVVMQIVSRFVLLERP